MRKEFGFPREYPKRQRMLLDATGHGCWNMGSYEKCG